MPSKIIPNAAKNNQNAGELAISVAKYTHILIRPMNKKNMPIRVVKAYPMNTGCELGAHTRYLSIAVVGQPSRWLFHAGADLFVHIQL